MKNISISLSIFFVILLSFLSYTKLKSNSKISPQSEFIKVIYSMPMSLDPTKMNDGIGLIVSELIYDGLLKMDDNYSIRNALAKSFYVSDYGKIYTFVLKDSFFHNGEKITAQDVSSALRGAKGCKEIAAKNLSVHVSTLYRWINKFKLEDMAI